MLFQKLTPRKKTEIRARLEYRVGITTDVMARQATFLIEKIGVKSRVG
jgi:hypothetical protein